MNLSLSNALVVLGLLVFSSSSLLAQQKVLEFKDGTEMSFKMLKQDPSKPIPLYVGPEVALNAFSTSEFNTEITAGLYAFYFLNPDLVLAGRAAFGLGLIDIYEQQSSFSQIELGAFYSFAKKTKVKDGSLKLKSKQTGYRQTTNYLLSIKEPTLRTWDVYAGLGSMTIPSQEYYNFDELSAIGVTDVSSLSVVGQSITTLEVGISTRKFTRDLFLLDGALRGQSKSVRWTAKVMLPIMKQANVLETPLGNGAFLDNYKEDVDYFNDQWSALGFGIFYQGIYNGAMTHLNFNGGYTFGLAMYPFLDSYVYASLGYTLGFGLNEPSQLIDKK